MGTWDFFPDGMNWPPSCIWCWEWQFVKLHKNTPRIFTAWYFKHTVKLSLCLCFAPYRFVQWVEAKVHILLTMAPDGGKCWALYRVHNVQGKSSWYPLDTVLCGHQMVWVWHWRETFLCRNLIFLSNSRTVTSNWAVSWHIVNIFKRCISIT